MPVITLLPRSRRVVAALAVVAAGGFAAAQPAHAEGNRATETYTREQIQLFATGNGRDTITDFSSGTDRVMSPLVDDLIIEAEIPPKP